MGTAVINDITVIDEDIIGSILEVFCTTTCADFVRVKLVQQPTTDKITFALVLVKPIEYHVDDNKHSFNLTVTDGLHNTTFPITITIADVQNKPPIFVGSTTAIINEDSAIGSLVMRVKAVDGDAIDSENHQRNTGRAIAYHLLSNPGDYFEINSTSGELRVANLLDKESFPSTNGVLTLHVKAVELASKFNNETADHSVATLTITILDINDEVPTFNHDSYSVSIEENVPNGTPLSGLDMFIRDTDSGSNSAFNIDLIDPSGVFSIEPPIATGSTSVSIRVANGPLDYENPNQRKFVLEVVASEAFTKEKFSSRVTVTVSLIDVNDNKPGKRTATNSCDYARDCGLPNHKHKLAHLSE